MIFCRLISQFLFVASAQRACFCARSCVLRLSFSFSDEFFSVSLSFMKKEGERREQD
jgi:hypothetical protein